MERKQRHLLGKTVPHHPVPPPARAKKRSSTWIYLAIAPILIGTALLTLSPATATNLTTAQRAVPALVAAPCDTKVNPDSAEKKQLQKALDGDIFPLIPKEITDYDTKDDIKTECVPGLWGRQIIGMLLYKTLGLLNYFAGALAVLATIYAGILYITGGVAEGTVKKAKTILAGTYLGFFIVLSARLIVQGSFYLFSDNPAAANKSLEEILPKEPIAP